MNLLLPYASEALPIMGWTAILVRLRRLSSPPRLFMGTPRLRTKGCQMTPRMLWKAPLRAPMVARVGTLFWLAALSSVISLHLGT